MSELKLTVDGLQVICRSMSDTDNATVAFKSSGYCPVCRQVKQNCVCVVEYSQGQFVRICEDCARDNSEKPVVVEGSKKVEVAAKKKEEVAKKPLFSKKKAKK